ncbi:hypothetical protein SAMN05216464_10899 [Mucilaginibacter pineti]|uniref:N-acetyltransferase domain-containing protein n=1 Tax=Mucilaginibacter pineti TaxID=1391627 RepID=A0A1G7ENG6_9SPHI|nr:hypothetical protein [Mucilaginibacter pineti]SDE65201.1 hypothetical protein SAMN05216464_10899 [Mucilaginibacter pineti]
MYVKASDTGEEVRVSITKIDAKEIALINKSKRFDFNWNKEKANSVYKLTGEGIQEPLGLISLIERPDDLAMEIRLIAVSKDNKGKERKYERIAGCMIAFACKEAFTVGYQGFICLKPKTLISDHYKEKYNLISTKLFLISEGKNSLDLIHKYYQDGKEK